MTSARGTETRPRVVRGGSVSGRRGMCFRSPFRVGGASFAGELGSSPNPAAARVVAVPVRSPGSGRASSSVPPPRVFRVVASLVFSPLLRAGRLVPVSFVVVRRRCRRVTASGSGRLRGACSQRHAASLPASSVAREKIDPREPVSGSQGPEKGPENAWFAVGNSGHP